MQYIYQNISILKAAEKSDLDVHVIQMANEQGMANGVFFNPKSSCEGTKELKINKYPLGTSSVGRGWKRFTEENNIFSVNLFDNIEEHIINGIKNLIP